MKITYSASALDDLLAIEAYLETRSVSGFASILLDILTVESILVRNPDAGRLSRREDFRTFITPRYRYVISYHHSNDTIEILGIHKHQNRDYG